MKTIPLREAVNSGFSFIELLFVLTIIAILTTLAIPTYHQYVIKAHRADAKLTLLNLTSQMEMYYAKHHTYATANLEELNGSNKSTHGFYMISLTHLTKNTFTLTATPLGNQGQLDLLCQAFTINSVGQKEVVNGPAGPPQGNAASCWS